MNKKEKATSQNPTETQKTSVKTDEPIKKRNFFKTMWPYLKGEKKRLTIGVILSFLTGAVVACQPLVIKYLVDDGINIDFADPADAWVVNIFRSLFGTPSGDELISLKVKIVLLMSAIYVALSAIRLFSWSFVVKNLYNALENTLLSLRSRFFHHIQCMCMRFYDKNSSGDLFNCIMGSPMENIKGYLYSIIQNVPFQAVSLAISLIALLNFSWYLTLILIAVVLAMTALSFFARRKIRAQSREYLDAEKETSKYITDMLHGADAVKMYAIEDNATRNFDRYLGDMKEKGYRLRYTSFLEAAKPEFTQYFGIGVVYLVGGILCVKGELSVGVLYAFLSSMGTILGTCYSWLSVFMQRSNAEVALDRIETIMEENTSTPEATQDELRSVEVERASAMRAGKPVISFKDVTFAYDNKPIFKNFNCDIRYGESIGLAGSSGSGKSTFTKLVMRLYEINGGEILVHGRNVKSFPIHDLRMSFGVVPQAPFIFNGTIWDNIRIARPDATGYEIIKAMEIAHVHEFVNNLPMGWSTVIGDGALGLSGGQKQRIAIARAVLKNPDILIFDEATSALDNISERHISEAMNELMKSHTVLIVAHRLSTIRHVNRILVFDKGEIVEEGTYDELAERPGLFREFLNMPADEEKHEGAPESAVDPVFSK